MTFANAPFRPRTAPDAGDRRYVYLDRRIELAVNVALVTRRPLLVTGLPGSGKSTLARDVAETLDWAYVEKTITSRTRLDDLTGAVDLVRRLSDAQVNKLKDDEDYLVPGVLWWAVDPDSAATRIGGEARDPRDRREQTANGVVVLLDEMDKAEPDLPNDLLGPLDGLRLSIPFVGDMEPKDDKWLVVVTSNGERAMPPAFLRRCVSLELDRPDKKFLIAVARSHHGDRKDDLYGAVAKDMLELVTQAASRGQREPSTAEYLDTVAASIEFGERPGSDLWDGIVEAALRKTRSPASPAAVATGSQDG
jgi:MoxR-like ATPase